MRLRKEIFCTDRTPHRGRVYDYLSLFEAKLNLTSVSPPQSLLDVHEEDITAMKLKDTCLDNGYSYQGFGTFEVAELASITTKGHGKRNCFIVSRNACMQFGRGDPGF